MKTFTALTLLLLSTALWADWPDRVVELDVHSEVHVSNNYFPVTAFFNNPLVVDLNDMAQTLSPSGLVVSTSNINRFELNVAPTNTLKFGLFGETQIYGLVSIPDALLSLLANGNGTTGATSSGTWNSQNLKGDIFADVGLKADVKWNKWHFFVQPTYFVPLLHLDNILATYSVTSSPTTGTTGIIQTNIPVYSVAPLPNSSNASNFSFQPNQLSISGGLDLGLEADYPLFPWLTVGGSLVNLPLLPAQMSQGTLLQTTQTVTTVDPTTNSGNPLKTTSTSAWTQTLGSISVIRPFEARALAVLYPFRDPWLSVKPSLGLGVWGGNYLNGGLAVELNLHHWTFIRLDSDYSYGFWNQTLGLGFNVRLFELDLAVGSMSTDFVKSFTDGVTAAVDVKLGF